MYNEGVGILDLTVDLAARRQASGTTAGTENKHMGVQIGTSGVPDIIVKGQTEMGEGSGRFH